MDLQKKSKLVLETLKENYLHLERRHSHLVQKIQTLMTLGTFFFAIFTFYNVKTDAQQYFIQISLLLALVFALIANLFSIYVLSNKKFSKIKLGPPLFDDLKQNRIDFKEMARKISRSYEEAIEKNTSVLDKQFRNYTRVVYCLFIAIIIMFLILISEILIGGKT